MKNVLINHDFRDVHTGEIHRAGNKEQMTDERIAEIKAVNPEFVSVIGLVPEEPIEEPIETPAPKKKAKAK